MNPLQEVTVKLLTPPGAKIDNTSATTAEIDTAGYDYCQIYVALGDTDIAMAALKVQETDVSATSLADVTGLVFGTSAQISGAASTLPAADSDNKLYCFDISLLGRKRYLDLVATAGDGSTGTYLTAWAVLSRAKKSPVTAAERGCAQILRV